jgi:hypothetical protein
MQSDEILYQFIYQTGLLLFYKYMINNMLTLQQIYFPV